MRPIIAPEAVLRHSFESATLCFIFFRRVPTFQSEFVIGGVCYRPTTLLKRVHNGRQIFTKSFCRTFASMHTTRKLSGSWNSFYCVTIDVCTVNPRYNEIALFEVLRFLALLRLSFSSFAFNEILPITKSIVLSRLLRYNESLLYRKRISYEYHTSLHVCTLLVSRDATNCTRISFALPRDLGGLFTARPCCSDWTPASWAAWVRWPSRPAVPA